MKKIYYLIAMAVTAFTFTSCEDVPEPFGQPINPNAGETVVVEPTGSGTEADPYNVASIIKETKDLASGQTTDKNYYVKGYVESTETFFDKYGSISYFICDDKEGKTNKFYVYSGQGLGNTKFSGLNDLKAGDEVTICGKITNYKGTIEFQSQNYIVELNGVKAGGGGDTPSGDAKAVSVADFLAAAVNTTDFYQLTGTIKNLKDGDQYGNFDIEDATGSVYVYGLLSEKGGEKKKFQELVAAKGIANGKKITIIGNRGEHNSNAQVANAYFVKIEDGEGGGGQTGGDAKAVSVADFLAAAVSTDVWYQLTGTVKNMKEDGSDQYGNFDIEDATGSVYVYGLLSEKGGAKKKFQELIAAKGIANGKKITIIGNRGEHNSNAQVANAYFVKIEDGEGGGTGGDTPSGTYLDESFAEGKGSFTIEDKVFSGVWTAASYGSDKYMMATSYIKADGESSKTNHDAESWLISPEMNLSSATNPVLTFAQVINKFFGTIADEAMVYVKKEGGEWTKLTITYPATPSGSFSKFTDEGANVTVSLANYKSAKTQIAFVYKGSTAKAGTWEIKDIKVAEAQ